MRCSASVRLEAVREVPRFSRIILATAVGLVLATAGALPMAPASKAQGFFQSLFGGGSTPPPAPPQTAPPMARAPGSAIPFRGAGELGRMPPPRSAPAAGEAPTQGGGTYRTVCVRLCDGYFFPVSSQTTRRGFYRDAGLCRSKCGEEGRLFYAPAPGIDVAQMRDLTGRSYPALGNAFLYRKRYVPSCRCKPEPWSATELMRHARYAAAEDATRPHRPLVGLIVSGRPAPVIASAVIEGEVPPADAPALAKIKAPVDGGDGLAPTPGLTTGGVAGGDAATRLVPSVPEVAAKPVRAARKPGREKEKARQAATRKAPPPVATPRTAPARQPAVAAPRQVWPGDRPG